FHLRVAPLAEEGRLAPGAGLLGKALHQRRGGQRLEEPAVEPLALRIELAQALAGLVAPLARRIDLQIALPLPAGLVAIDPLEDQGAIEVPLGELRIELQRALGGGQRLRQLRRLL